MAHGIGRSKGGCITRIRLAIHCRGRPLRHGHRPRETQALTWLPERKAARRCRLPCGRQATSLPAGDESAMICDHDSPSAVGCRSCRRAPIARIDRHTINASAVSETSPSARSTVSRASTGSQPASTESPKLTRGTASCAVTSPHTRDLIKIRTPTIGRLSSKG